MSHQYNIILAKDIDVSNISLGEIKSIRGGGKLVDLTYNNGLPLVIQTPEMICQSGVQITKSSAMFNLSLKGADTRRALKSFKKSFVEFDEYLASLDLEVFSKSKYCPQIISDIFKLCFNKKSNGELPCSVQDSDGCDVNTKVLSVRGARVTLMLKCVGLWIVAGRYGVSWKPLIIRCDPPPIFHMLEDDRIDDEVFCDDEESEEEEEEGEEEEEKTNDIKKQEINTKTVMVNTK
jgi:hypothetical protein